MIRNHRDREKLAAALAGDRRQRDEIVARLKSAGVTTDAVASAVSGFDELLRQRQAEIEEYDQKLVVPLNGSTWELSDLPRVFLILRVREGTSQDAFGARMGLLGNKISRYEKLGYRGLSFERLVKMLTAVGFDAQVTLVPRATTSPAPAPESGPEPELDASDDVLDPDGAGDLLDELMGTPPVLGATSTPSPVQEASPRDGLPAVTF